jgi:hypothetical protein
MSAIFAMMPSSETKAMDRGIRVFFIQKRCFAATGKTNSIPQFSQSVLRCISPWAREDSVLTTSALTRCAPIRSPATSAAPLAESDTHIKTINMTSRLNSTSRLNTNITTASKGWPVVL